MVADVAVVQRAGMPTARQQAAYSTDLCRQKPLPPVMMLDARRPSARSAP
ncbi:hypothetical protein SCALM49S_06000 [Streptomyces californicus]